MLKSDMRELKQTILRYLYTGHSPTVVSFPDDGLPEIYQILNSEIASPQNYDPNFTFVPVSVKYLEQITSAFLEAEIDDELTRDSVQGDTILETINNGYEIVVILDDIDILEEPLLAIELCDAIIKKYRNRVRFVYLIENVSLLSVIKEKLPAYSSILDAVVYKEIGQGWSTTELSYECRVQFGEKLADDIVDEIAVQSGNHYGLFKRLYRDHVLGTTHTTEYINNLLGEFSLDQLSYLKKIIAGKKLSPQELRAKEIFELVNFIENGKIKIPLIADALVGFKIKGKVRLDTTLPGKQKLAGLDLDLLTRSERKVIEFMIEHNHFISKDQLAEIAWGEKVAEKYSEWALDKRMSRLRKNLSDLGFAVDVETLYGEGYKLVINN